MKISFLGLPDHPQAKVALIPAPLEYSTSWKKGTKEAPLEILKVSPNMEFFDEEYFLDPSEKMGFFTYPVEELSFDPEEALKEISQKVEETLSLNRFPLVIGGEHTVTLGSIRVLKKFFPRLKVVHLDAHLDLRDRYNHSSITHATVMRRIYELGVPVLSIGIRTLCKEEYEFIKQENYPVIWAKDLKVDLKECLKKIESFLKDGYIFLSFDMDVFDPAVAPGVGTPEPGGIDWWEALNILKILVKHRLIGMDLVEVKPDPGNPVTEFLAAKLIFKVAVYLAAKNEGLL
ncbi:agmatinase [Thermodesulfobacterium sp.]|jgi:agmatinase|uniref:agmatinase n=1 Tax=Thermodesulfobacterium sp. TaxID=1965289 RepID=UPI00257C742B|nr:agmatinase [Thermodesulfobacterium sp.]MBZ4681411.1 speB [Thermodesulfobacterium sp.]MDK2861067.1 agmatinase [Thermodesulfobacterium sp.]MDN5379532.1 agmatinase [Thermodesulfobacterium sp.]